MMPRGVSVGVAAIWSESPLVGEETRTFFVPTLVYEGKRVFFRGIGGGVHLAKRNGFELDAIVAARLEGWDAKDLDAVELAATGVDRALLSDRDNGIDAGAALSWQGMVGKLTLQVKGDIANASDGYEVALGYASKPLRLGDGLLTANVGLNYWSDALTDYYYGILPEEQALGVPRYRPGAAVVPNVGLNYLKPLPNRWLLVAGFDYRWLSDEMVDSPLVDNDSDGVTSIFLGLSRSFGRPQP